MAKNKEEIIIDPNTKTYERILIEDGIKKKEIITVKRKNADVKTGLSYDDVEDRLCCGWANNETGSKTKPIKAIIFGNVFTVFNILSFGVAIWIFSIGEFTQGLFLFIVIANTLIGIIQEIKAKKTIDKLSLISAPTVFVIREKTEQEIILSELVLDDIMVLKAGKQVCSDSIIVEGNVEVNESLLTGESDAIIKKEGDVLFSGSFIVSGSCLASVDKVGKDNYIETLASQAKKYFKPKSDLLRSLKLVIRIVGVLIFILVPLYFFLVFNNLSGGIQDPAYREVVTNTSAAIIGMIPAGLFLLTSIALSVGVVRLAKNKTLVQELYCIEMLARVNILCLDKTGTITDGTMSVSGLIEYQNDTGLNVKQIISAILNALKDENLTSKALEAKFGLGKKLKAKALIPFSSSRKYSAVDFDKYHTFILGAPEFILKNNYELISYDVERNAALGNRVLLLARADEIKGKEIIGEVKPLALVLIQDTIREEAVETIKYFNDNSVSIRVISGDNPITVSKVAERAGIIGANDYISLDGMSDKEVVKAADKYTIFGRVTPPQKKLLINTLKGLGNTVAMTGDGVNDILALKAADCSIAMASGSEAARNVSHLVLLDSNFASMPKVVSEGRRVINNIQRVASLFLTKTIFSSMLLIFVTIAILCQWNLEYPFEPKQLYPIELLVIGIPSFILAIESNKNLIKGNFLLNILKNAIPGAFTVVLNIVLVFLVKDALVINPDEVTMIMVISATFTCMLVLFRTCRPFNYLRAGLFGIMFSLYLIAVLAFPSFFGFAQLFNSSPSSILLLSTLMLSSYPLISIFAEGYGWIKTKMKTMANDFSKIEI